jgi:hypothetical protein
MRANDAHVIAGATRASHDERSEIEGEAPTDKTTDYRGCGTPREQAWTEGATRAPLK